MSTNLTTHTVLCKIARATQEPSKIVVTRQITRQALTPPINTLGSREVIVTMNSQTDGSVSREELLVNSQATTMESLTGDIQELLQIATQLGTLICSERTTSSTELSAGNHPNESIHC